MSKEKIVCMASFPKRYNGMIDRLGELCKQCDQFQLYLDGYEDIPEEIGKFQNCIPICDGTNLHDKGKFYGFDKFKDDYVLTVDDDFSYPNNYVDYMCNMLDCHPNWVMTLLGIIKESKEYVFPRNSLDEGHQSIIAGTGCSIFIPGNIGFFPTLEQLKIYDVGADGMLALHCHNNKIPMYIVPRKQNFIQPTHYVNKRNDMFNQSVYKEYNPNWVFANLSE